MDEMAVDVEKARSIGRLMHQMVVPNLVVERTRFHRKFRFSGGRGCLAARLLEGNRTAGRSRGGAFFRRKDMVSTPGLRQFSLFIFVHFWYLTGAWPRWSTGSR